MNKTKKNNAKRNRYLLIGLIIFVLLALVFLPQLRRELAEETPLQHYEKLEGEIFIPEHSPLRERIVVSEVAAENVQRQVSAPATVEANPSKRANIFPPAGGRIVRLYVNMGQSITAGQPLFEIYSPEAAEIQTDFVSAKSALALAERELRRKEELHERGITPLRELEEVRTEFEIALSEKKGASLKMQIMGFSEDDIGKPLIVRSPINGRLVDLAVAPGEFIAEPEEPLMIIADLSNVWVTASIQEKDIRFVSPGGKAKARFSAYPEVAYEGTVLFVSDILDEDTRTTKVRIEFENEDRRLKPGMFSYVNFFSSPEPAIVVPAKAVLQRRDFNYVYIETAPYTFKTRKVITGETIDDKIVILHGLTENEPVIIDNAILLP